MFQYLSILLVVIDSLAGKPIIAKNISDCSITEDGLLHYHGQHSFTKFEHECLPWNDMQTIYPKIINEPNFFNDPSVKAAKNYCRNPNMNINGPWCFVFDDDILTMEQCDVCQSLASKPSLPIEIDSSDEIAPAGVSGGFFQSIYDELKRYGAYIRAKVMEIIARTKITIRKISARLFN